MILGNLWRARSPIALQLGKNKHSGYNAPISNTKKVLFPKSLCLLFSLIVRNVSRQMVWIYHDRRKKHREGAVSKCAPKPDCAKSHKMKRYDGEVEVLNVGLLERNCRA